MALAMYLSSSHSGMDTAAGALVAAFQGAHRWPHHYQNGSASVPELREEQDLSVKMQT